ncbi:hypothetical protein L6452_22118 [Arctium lappa]|uniref:Uncharacterized protein n=1 Tax=Arctium lappa TaxID=4217 RepID=A0ACB9AZN9_ARCLA|nr:hypothetical protein L6452_22118 [Arctium lappa]
MCSDDVSTVLGRFSKIDCFLANPKHFSSFSIPKSRDSQLLILRILYLVNFRKCFSTTAHNHKFEFKLNIDPLVNNILQNHPVNKALSDSDDVTEIFVQQAWKTIHLTDITIGQIKCPVLRVRVDFFSADISLELFRRSLQQRESDLRQGRTALEDLPTEETILAGIREMGSWVLTLPHVIPVISEGLGLEDALDQPQQQSVEEQEREGQDVEEVHFVASYSDDDDDYYDMDVDTRAAKLTVATVATITDSDIGDIRIIEVELVEDVNEVVREKERNETKERETNNPLYQTVNQNTQFCAFVA